MNNFGKLEKIIESQKPKYKRDAFIYFGLAIYCLFCLDTIGYYSPNAVYFTKLAVFVFVFIAIYLLNKDINYVKSFESIKLYTHGLMIDDFCFDYKNIILEIKKRHNYITLVFKNDEHVKTITISTRKNNVYTIINKIKNYN